VGGILSDAPFSAFWRRGTTYSLPVFCHLYVFGCVVSRLCHDTLVGGCLHECEPMATEPMVCTVAHVCVLGFGVLVSSRLAQLPVHVHCSSGRTCAPIAGHGGQPQRVGDASIPTCTWCCNARIRLGSFGLGCCPATVVAGKEIVPYILHVYHLRHTSIRSQLLECRTCECNILRICQ